MLFACKFHMFAIDFNCLLLFLFKNIIYPSLTLLTKLFACKFQCFPLCFFYCYMFTTKFYCLLLYLSYFYCKLSFTDPRPSSLMQILYALLSIFTAYYCVFPILSCKISFPDLPRLLYLASKIHILALNFLIPR
jgi:hypothetical protein